MPYLPSFCVLKFGVGNICLSCRICTNVTLSLIQTLSDNSTADNIKKHRVLKEEITNDEQFLLLPHLLQIFSTINLSFIEMFHIVV